MSTSPSGKPSAGAQDAEQWRASWNHLPGLRLHLACQSLWHRVPGGVVSLMWGWTLGCVSSWTSVLVWLGLTYGMQRVAHAVVALVIMPGQRATTSVLRWLSGFDLVHKHAPIVTDLMQQLEACSRGADTLRDRLCSAGNGTAVTMTTPDGVELDVMWMPPRSVSPIGAAVYIPGNAERFEFTRFDTVRQYHSRGLAYLVFNFRGVGRSTGSTTRDGMIVDLATVLDYLRRCHGFDSNRIVLVGHSIGGAVATEVGALVPGVHVCNDRSFSRLSDVTRYTLLDNRVLTSQHWMSRTLTLAAGWLISYGTLWEMDSCRYWPLIKGSKWSAGIQNDSIIPHPVQLRTALAAEGVADIGPEILLVVSTDAHNRAWTLPELNQHMRFVLQALPQSEPVG